MYLPLEMKMMAHMDMDMIVINHDSDEDCIYDNFDDVPPARDEGDDDNVW